MTTDSCVGTMIKNQCSGTVSCHMAGTSPSIVGLAHFDKTPEGSSLNYSLVGGFKHYFFFHVIYGMSSQPH